MSDPKTYAAEEINAELTLAGDFNSSDIFQRKRNRGALIEIIVQLRGENEIYRQAVDSVEDLMNQSEGVTGLHKNGDVAPWDELLDGGRFPWLAPVSSALEVLHRMVKS